MMLNSKYSKETWEFIAKEQGGGGDGGWKLLGGNTGSNGVSWQNGPIRILTESRPG